MEAIVAQSDARIAARVWRPNRSDALVENRELLMAPVGDQVNQAPQPTLFTSQ
jgi:hypothetical protein